MFTRGLSYIASISFTRVNFTYVRKEKLRNSGNPPHGRLALLQPSWKLLSCGSCWCFFHLSSNYSLTLSLSCTDVASKSILACEQALLFGRGARFACPNRRACSQANSIPRTFAHWTGLDWTGLACRHGHFANDQWVFCGWKQKRALGKSGLAYQF